MPYSRLKYAVTNTFHVIVDYELAGSMKPLRLYVCLYTQVYIYATHFGKITRHLARSDIAVRCRAQMMP